MADKTANSFFQTNKDQLSKTQQAINDASSTNDTSKPVEVAGSYIMQAKTVVAKKKDGTLLVSPSLKLSDTEKSKGALQLNFILEVTDPTEVVPVGSSLFHTVTLAQPNGATQEKVQNTSKFMKPVICALIGKDSFNFTPEFVDEYLTIEHDDNLKVTKNHKMTSKVMVICEEYEKNNGQKAIKVKSIRAVKPGERSSSIKQEPSESANLTGVADQIQQSMGTTTVETITDSSVLGYDPSLDAESYDQFKIEDA